MISLISKEGDDGHEKVDPLCGVSGLPKVNRLTPVNTSRPIVPAISPMMAEIQPRRIDFPDRVVTRQTPKIISEKYGRTELDGQLRQDG